jgi:hypothetical protein
MGSLVCSFSAAARKSLDLTTENSFALIEITLVEEVRLALEIRRSQSMGTRCFFLFLLFKPNAIIGKST